MEGIAGEEYKLTWEVLRDKYITEKFFAELREMDCCCGHIALHHRYTTWHSPYELSDSVVFTRCNWKCPCQMFKRDNLLWLERKQREREDNNISSMSLRA